MKDKHILYVPVFVGELGWEIVNYVPHVNYIFSKNKYDEVHVVTRLGREFLYPMGTNFYTVKVSSKKSMANNGPKAPKNSIFQDLCKKFKEVDTIAPPPSGMRYFKRRKFLKYSDSDNMSKWSISENSVTLLVRGRAFGSHKNWDAQNWNNLCVHLVNKGYSPVLTGIKHSVNVDIIDGCIDLQGQTSMQDLFEIMSKSRFVIGQSTGPAHFASMSGFPHAIWGSPRLRDRYLKSWNPHRTLVEYQSCGFDCSASEVLKLADRMIERIS